MRRDVLIKFMKSTSLMPVLVASALTLSTGVVGQVASSDPPELVLARTRYEQEVKIATDPIKVRYARTLEALKKTVGAKGDVASAVAVQRELDSLGLASAGALGARGEAKVVIWNQHNSGFNDRGAKTVNVVLLTGGKEVWRKDGIEVPWEAGKDTNVTVMVPIVPTEKLRVEVPTVRAAGGGLAEIEYVRDGKNVARGRRVTVSAVWESNKNCTGATLTDGITTSKQHQVGYWLFPNKEEGWAEINLGIRD